MRLETLAKLCMFHIIYSGQGIWTAKTHKIVNVQNMYMVYNFFSLAEAFIVIEKEFYGE